jgi:hypothetical protein
VTVVELDFVCDVCGRQVEDGDGSLYVRDVDLQVARADQSEWQRVHGGGPVSIGQLMSFPPDALWLIHHDRCRPAESDGYDIAVEQVRTWRDLVRWTAHLMEKSWLPSTNWAALIGGAAEGRNHRIADVTRHGDAA